MAGDEAMAAAGRGNDLYAGMVASGAVATRAEAKLGIISAMYGGTRGESGRMVTRLARRYPAAFGLVEEAARAGERGEVVRTLLGRGSPVPRGSWTEQAGEEHRPDSGAPGQRRSWGRFTRNFVVQGTAAEWALCWLALLRNQLWQTGADLPPHQRPQLVMFLHDEVLVHAPAALAEEVAVVVRRCAGDAGRLLFGPSGVDFPRASPTGGQYGHRGAWPGRSDRRRRP
jgi:DNA polymerase-1